MGDGSLAAIEEGKISLEEFTAYQENMIRRLVAEAQADERNRQPEKRHKAV